MQITGRHDPAIIHRARAVVDSVVAIGLLDLLTARFRLSVDEGISMKYGLIGEKTGAQLFQTDP